MKTQRWMARVGVVLGIAVPLFASFAESQDCPESVDGLSVERWGEIPHRIQVSGSYAVLTSPGWCGKPGCSGSFLAVADVSDPEEPRIIGDSRDRKSVV